MGGTQKLSLGFDAQYRVKTHADGKAQSSQLNFDPVGNLNSLIYPRLIRSSFRAMIRREIFYSASTLAA